ncbi:MAG: hypothetical protein Q4G39_07905, partial [Brachymonas sp.]|nr:hypothetical protein [Brachymonas sp.]
MIERSAAMTQMLTIAPSHANLCTHPNAPRRDRAVRRAGALLLAWVVFAAGCATRKPPPPVDVPPAGNAIMREKSRWVPVPWSSVPGFTADAVGEAWPAWLQSCQKP